MELTPGVIVCPNEAPGRGPVRAADPCMVPDNVWPPCWSNIFPDSCRHQLPSIACQPMQMEIQYDPSCPLCRTRPCTVRHILSCYPTALNQERYTWRHDFMLTHLTLLLKLHLPYGTTLYADLPGLSTSENPAATIPTSVATTMHSRT